MPTTTTELGDTIPTIIEKALLTSQHNAVMAGLCWNKTKGQGKGSTINVPYFGEVTARTLTEGVDMSNDETLEDTNVQISLNEIGCKVILTDVALEDDQEELKSVAGTVLGQAMEKKRDTDLLGQIDDATTSLCGTGTTLTMGHIAAARATLAGNLTTAGGPAPMPYVCVLHPYQELDIVDVVTPIVPTATYLNVTGTAFTDDIIRNYSIGRLFGMPVVTDGNIEIDSTPDVKGGVFSMGEGGAIILGTARNWDVKPDYDNSLRGWELVCVGRYGVGEYLAGWIVELYSDATAPA